MFGERSIGLKQLLTQSTDIFGRYVKKQGERLSPDGVYCKKHASQLIQSFNKHLPQISAHLGKVQRVSYDKDSPEIIHLNGESYNYHYLVIGNIGDSAYAYDPFLWNLNPDPIPVDLYISSAFFNPQAVIWANTT
ncbi:MAG: hypothetical protein AAB859_01020 [Patescibacteria group bacterium]